MPRNCLFQSPALELTQSKFEEYIFHLAGDEVEPFNTAIKALEAFLRGVKARVATKKLFTEVADGSDKPLLVSEFEIALELSKKLKELGISADQALFIATELPGKRSFTVPKHANDLINILASAAGMTARELQRGQHYDPLDDPLDDPAAEEGEAKLNDEIRFNFKYCQ